MSGQVDKNKLFKLRKKLSFPLRISTVNAIKSAGNSTGEILNGKLHFLRSVRGCVFSKYGYDKQ